jgi:hypothetical protein
VCVSQHIIAELFLAAPRSIRTQMSSCIKLFLLPRRVLEQVYTFPVGRQLLLFRYHKCINEYCFYNNFHSRWQKAKAETKRQREKCFLALTLAGQHWRVFWLIYFHNFLLFSVAASTINLEHSASGRDNNNKSKSAGRTMNGRGAYKGSKRAHSARKLSRAGTMKWKTLKQSINFTTIHGK